jgi:hypothetical protein
MTTDSAPSASASALPLVQRFLNILTNDTVREDWAGNNLNENVGATIHPTDLTARIQALEMVDDPRPLPPPTRPSDPASVEIPYRPLPVRDLVDPALIEQSTAFKNASTKSFGRDIKQSQNSSRRTTKKYNQSPKSMATPASSDTTDNKQTKGIITGVAIAIGSIITLGLVYIMGKTLLNPQPAPVATTTPPQTTTPTTQIRRRRRPRRTDGYGYVYDHLYTPHQPWAFEVDYPYHAYPTPRFPHRRPGPPPPVPAPPPPP